MVILSKFFCIVLDKNVYYVIMPGVTRCDYSIMLPDTYAIISNRFCFCCNLFDVEPFFELIFPTYVSKAGVLGQKPQRLVIFTLFKNKQRIDRLNSVAERFD